MTSENPAKQNNPTPNANGETDYHSAEPKPEVSPAIGPTEPEAEPASKSGRQSCDKQKHWLDYVEAGMAGIGLLVLIAYTIFTWLMYCANKKAADAAKSAADTATNSLKISERAYLGTDRPSQVPEGIYPTFPF